MKKNLLILSLLTIFTLTANAGNNKHESNSQPSNSSISSATALATPKSSASATGGSVKSTIQNDVRNTNKQKQEQIQGQEQVVNVSGDVTQFPRIASSAYAPSMSPSAMCLGVASGGAQGVGFGLSLGKSYESKQCNQRELARMFAQMGRMDSAMEVLCSIDGSDVVGDCKLFKKSVLTETPQSVGVNEQSNILSTWGK